MPDALVVGAGIVGSACARALALEGLRVGVVDGAPASGATSAGMGHIIVVDDDPHLLALTRRGRELWVDLAPELPGAAEWTEAGTLWVAEEPEDMDAARTKAATLQEAGVRAEVVDAAGLRALEPEVAPDLPGGLRVPDDRILYPPVAADWLLREAEARGARTHFGVPVQGIEGGTVRLASGETLRAGWVINAAGGAALDLLPVPIPIPINPRKGHLVITERQRPLCHHQLVELGYQRSAHGNATRSVAFNVQPRPTGQVLIGSSRQYGDTSPAVDRSIVAEMLGRAVRFVPALADSMALRVWTGFRAATPNKLPIIGPVPGAPDIIMAAGHEGLGITTSLVTAELVRDCVLERASAIDPAPFRITGPEDARVSA